MIHCGLLAANVLLMKIEYKVIIWPQPQAMGLQEIFFIEDPPCIAKPITRLFKKEDYGRRKVAIAAIASSSLSTGRLCVLRLALKLFRCTY